MSNSPSNSQAAADAPEGNIYASKTELLEWVNGLLQLQLSKLEQFASGAVFCQLLDAYFPNIIPMHKVRGVSTRTSPKQALALLDAAPWTVSTSAGFVTRLYES